MFKKFNLPELIILLAIVVLILISEYQYVVLDNLDRAIFLGLWPPTMVGLLIYLNLKKKQ